MKTCQRRMARSLRWHHRGPPRRSPLESQARFLRAEPRPDRAPATLPLVAAVLSKFGPAAQLAAGSQDPSNQTSPVETAASDRRFAPQGRARVQAGLTLQSWHQVSSDRAALGMRRDQEWQTAKATGTSWCQCSAPRPSLRPSSQRRAPQTALYSTCGSVPRPFQGRAQFRSLSGWSRSLHRQWRKVVPPRPAVPSSASG